MSGSKPTGDGVATGSLLRRLGHESILYGFANALQRAGTLLLLPLCAHAFSTEEMGVLGLALATFAVISVITALALDNSAHRWFYDDEDDSGRKRTIASWFWSQVAMCGTVAITGIAFAGPISTLLWGHPRHAGIIVALCAWLVLIIPGTVAGNLLRMQRRPVATILLMGSGVACQLFTAYFAIVVYRAGPFGYVIAQAASALVIGIVGLMLMRDWVHPRWTSMSRLRAMLVFALPLLPCAAAGWAMTSFGRFALQWHAGESEVGLFQLGATVGMAMTLLTSAFQLAWGPFALAMHKQPEHGHLYAVVLHLASWGGGLAATMLAILAPPILALIAPAAYAPAAVVVGPVAMGCALTALTYIIAIGPNIAKDNKPIALAMLGGAVFAIAANLALVPAMGIRGAALAIMIAPFVQLAILLPLAQRLHPLPFRVGFPLAAIAVAVAAVLWASAIPAEPGLANLCLRSAGAIPLIAVGLFGILLYRRSSRG